MADVEIQFNRNGKRSVLRSRGVQACLFHHALNVKKRADAMSTSKVAKFTAVSDVHNVSAHAHVWAKDAASIQSNIKHDSLVKSLASEGGLTFDG